MLREQQTARRHDQLASLVKQVRNGSSLLPCVGDTTHGSAGMLFKPGDAIMPVLNATDIDAFLPGCSPNMQ